MIRVFFASKIIKQIVTAPDFLKKKFNNDLCRMTLGGGYRPTKRFDKNNYLIFTSFR